MNNPFGIFPKDESFKKAIEFIKEHPSFTVNEYLRLFIKKYCKKIDTKNFAELLVWMYELIDDGE
jgi:hypothetical protein